MRLSMCSRLDSISTRWMGNLAADASDPVARADRPLLMIRSPHATSISCEVAAGEELCRFLPEVDYGGCR